MSDQELQKSEGAPQVLGQELGWAMDQELDRELQPAWLLVLASL